MQYEGCSADEDGYAYMIGGAEARFLSEQASLARVRPGPAMTAAGRLIVYDREELDLEHLHGRAWAVGDTVEVVRGNGPREGDRMGYVTVVEFEDDEDDHVVLRLDF